MPMADRIQIVFLYAIGQRVRWCGDRGDVWLIVARHYREGPDYGVVGYGMVRYDEEQRLQTMHAVEADLSAVEGTDAPLLR
jgi:hypothetical protein